MARTRRTTMKHEYYRRWRINKVGEALDALGECLSATHWDMYKRAYWSTFTKYQRMIEEDKLFNIRF